MRPAGPRGVSEVTARPGARLGPGSARAWLHVTLDFGEELPDWGTVVTVHLTLETAIPGMAAQVLAGKVVRRLKALVETGEVPTPAHNPAARPDAGESS